MNIKHAWISLCMLILSLFCATPLYALTRMSVKNYQRLDVTVSSVELTHIVVEHDRIRVVRGLQGQYFLDKDAGSGSIYLLPTPAYQKKVFSIFVITQKGRTYTLHCHPLDQPADTVLLILSQTMKRRPTMTHTHHAHVHESRKKGDTPGVTHPSRVTVVTRLLNAMMTHQVIQGYDYHRQVIVRHHFLADQTLKVWKPRAYLPREGRPYQGECFIVKNVTRHAVVLTPALFQTPNSEVIAITQPLLKAGEYTRVYRIQRVSHES